jgi:hypothetical protein
MQQIVDFILELDKLKGVTRKIRPLGLDRYENSAEHSWQLALLAASLAHHAEAGIEIDRVIRMLLVHDIGEIDTGDIMVFAEGGWTERKAAELAAVTRIFGLLPEPQRLSCSVGLSGNPPRGRASEGVVRHRMRHKENEMRFAKGSVVLGFAAVCFVVAASPYPAWADEDAACAAAEKAGKALVNFVTDASCKLTVNGQGFGVLAANKERMIVIPDNEQKIQCASTEVPGAIAEIEDRLTGCGSTVTLEVANIWRRFTAGKNGTVTDAETGVTWLQSDNGSDIDWEGAKKFCAGKGGRLPTDGELRPLHTEGRVTTQCGEYPCMMSHLFRLTSRFFWSSVPFEKDQAIVIGLAGFRPGVQSVKTNVSKDARALCVVGAK